MARVYGHPAPAAALPAFVDAAPFVVIVRALHGGGLTLRELATFAGVSYTLMRDLHQGTKPRLSRSTAEDLQERLLMLLPEGAA
jgi:hypothetical protein